MKSKAEENAIPNLIELSAWRKKRLNLAVFFSFLFKAL